MMLINGPIDRFWKVAAVEASLPDLSLQIVEFAREHGRVTIGDAIKLTGVSRNTLKVHLRNLVERAATRCIPNDAAGSGRCCLRAVAAALT